VKGKKKTKIEPEGDRVFFKVGHVDRKPSGGELVYTAGRGYLVSPEDAKRFIAMGIALPATADNRPIEPESRAEVTRSVAGEANVGQDEPTKAED
jgi:hypothetical protein